MSLFGRKEKEELERLRAQMSPEQIELADWESRIAAAKRELDKINDEVSRQEEKLSKIQEDIIETDENVLLQSFGMYTPHYAYAVSDEYKHYLQINRDKQKQMIKAKQAVAGNENWTVNGSAAKGRKMVADMQKLLLRAFNAECDDAIDHVKFNNIAACARKIESSADAISKLGSMMGISITRQYIRLKSDELHLMYEYQQKKQQEKEDAKEARARMREEAKLAKEIEEARKKLIKEQTHYQNALEKINAQLAVAGENEKGAIEEKKAQIEQQLQTIDKEFKDVDYRAANQRAGYVYIISNIGAFGENVYKIGMTRRLNPMERVEELGDASVPFNFDVHAMIFSDDAPGLESALHNAFANRKLNYVNQRREFFNVTLDEIKAVVKENYDKTVEFIDVPPAEQYRESLLMKQTGKGGCVR